jgi:hypothetical protein
MVLLRTGGMLLRTLLATLNPEFFAREFFHFTSGWSAATGVMESVVHRRLALNCKRQWGKSTISILAVHRLAQSEATVLIAAPSGRQSRETLRKVGGFLGVLGIRMVGNGVNRAAYMLPNGSRIVNLRVLILRFSGIFRSAAGFVAQERCINDRLLC